MKRRLRPRATQRSSNRLAQAARAHYHDPSTNSEKSQPATVMAKVDVVCPICQNFLEFTFKCGQTLADGSFAPFAQPINDVRNSGHQFRRTCTCGIGVELHPDTAAEATKRVNRAVNSSVFKPTQPNPPVLAV